MFKKTNIKALIRDIKYINNLFDNYLLPLWEM